MSNVSPLGSVSPVTVIVPPVTPSEPAVAVAKPASVPVVDGALQLAGTSIETAPFVSGASAV
jgi:hypothetical protein